MVETLTWEANCFRSAALDAEETVTSIFINSLFLSSNRTTSSGRGVARMCKEQSLLAVRISKRPFSLFRISLLSSLVSSGSVCLLCGAIVSLTMASLTLSTVGGGTIVSLNGTIGEDTLSSMQANRCLRSSMHRCKWTSPAPTITCSPEKKKSRCLYRRPQFSHLSIS